MQSGLTAYDAAIITAIAVSFVGIIWASYQLRKHRREIKIVGIVKAETGIKPPKYLLKLYEATFRPDSKGSGDEQR